MADLERQVHDYVSRLALPAPVRPDAIVAGAGPGRARRGRGVFLAAAVLLVVVVLGAAVLALSGRDDEIDVPTVGPTLIPTTWLREATILDAQPFAVTAAPSGAVLVGYGAWWSPDGASWEAVEVPGRSGTDPAFPGVITDVTATDEGDVVAVGAGGDRQAAVWTSEDGRSWRRVDDPDLLEPTGSIPESVSTRYGEIASVAATHDGYVAVGSRFTGSFAGETLTSAASFGPAVWTSADGRDWVRADPPDGTTPLTAVADTPRGPVALQVDGDETAVWRLDGRGWAEQGRIAGRADAVAVVGGHLVAAGARPGGDGTSAPTLWWSPDGSVWNVGHEEAASPLGTFTALEADGSDLLALGYAGPGELEVGPLALSTADGASWSPLPAVHSSPLTCTTAVDGRRFCSGQTGYPVGAAVVDGRLLLAVQEAATGPGDQEPSVTRLQTAIYRAGEAPHEPAVTPPLRARWDLPTTTVAAGSTVQGTIVVENDTGFPVVVPACNGVVYQVALVGDGVRQSTAWLACGGTATVPVGESRWPVGLRASSLGCLGPGGQGDAPRCLPDGSLPPLEPGTYQAVAEVQDTRLPVPDPTTIEVG